MAFFLRGDALKPKRLIGGTGAPRFDGNVPEGDGFIRPQPASPEFAGGPLQALLGQGRDTAGGGLDENFLGPLVAALLRASAKDKSQRESSPTLPLDLLRLFLPPDVINPAARGTVLLDERRGYTSIPDRDKEILLRRPIPIEIFQFLLERSRRLPTQL